MNFYFLTLSCVTYILITLKDNRLCTVLDNTSIDDVGSIGYDIEAVGTKDSITEGGLSTRMRVVIVIVKRTSGHPTINIY